nr:Protein F10E7.6 [Haemonchus contortus]
MLLRIRPTTALRFTRYFASVKQEKASEPKFSESAAFQGRKRGDGVLRPTFKFDYYSSDEFGTKKLLSAFGSIAVFVLYFGYLREPSDLDEIWNAPPHILTANLERKMLREQIKEAESKGKDTSLLKAQLEYVDVKEAALEIQLSKDNKKK